MPRLQRTPPSPSSLVGFSASPQESFSGTQSTVPGPLRRDVAQRRHNVEPEPPQWEHMEALWYRTSPRLPDHGASVVCSPFFLSSDMTTAIRQIVLIFSRCLRRRFYPKKIIVQNWDDPSSWCILMKVSTHRIDCTYRGWGRMVTIQEDSSTRGAWALYSRQMGQILALVNNGMKGDMKSQTNKDLLLRRIYSLVFHDVAVNASAWRLHVLGYLALLQHFGGVRALILQCRYTEPSDMYRNCGAK